MNKITVNPSHLYTRSEVGRPISLLLDAAFCSFHLCVALSMTVFAVLILIMNHIISPSLGLISKILLTLPSKTL